MASITPGTGATINAPSIEGQLFQLIHFINNAEAIAGGDFNNFSLEKSEDGILTSSFTLAGQYLYTPATGVYAESATPYLASTPFTAGTPAGTIKGITLAQYFVDAVSYALVWQKNTIKNPQKVTGVQMSFDYQNCIFSGSLSLPYATFLGVSGAVSESATEWLIT